MQKGQPDGSDLWSSRGAVPVAADVDNTEAVELSECHHRQRGRSFVTSNTTNLWHGHRGMVRPSGLSHRTKCERSVSANERKRLFPNSHADECRRRNPAIDRD